jgi:hypothetical protein
MSAVAKVQCGDNAGRCLVAVAQVWLRKASSIAFGHKRKSFDQGKLTSAFVKSRRSPHHLERLLRPEAV